MKYNFGRKRVYIQHWLEMKPYDESSDYDEFYLEVCNKILPVLMEAVMFEKYKEFTRAEYRNLAVVLASYFEDFISEIGIWKVFVEKNQSLFGYYIPFYEMESYDIEYINEQDIRFIIWRYIDQLTDQMLIPNYPALKDLSHKIFNILEGFIDDAPATDFYKKFFTIPDDIDFYQVKAKLQWLAFGSYILKDEFGKEYNNQLREFAQESPDPVRAIKFGYSFENNFLYSAASSYSFLKVADWLAALAKASPKVIEGIKNVCQYVPQANYYEYQGHNEEHFLFEHVQTGKPIKVSTKSYANLDNILIGAHCSFALVKWLDDWWGTGSFLGSEGPLPPQELKEEKSRMHVSFYLNSKENQEKIWEITQEGHDNFIEYFGAPFHIVNNERELNKAINELMTFQYKKRKEMGKEVPSEEPPEMNLALDRFHGQKIAMISDRKSGLAFTPETAKAVELLEKKTLTVQENEELFAGLLATQEHITQYLFDKYPTDHIKFPVSGSDFYVAKYIPFLHRYQECDTFKDYPQMTLVEDGKPIA